MKKISFTENGWIELTSLHPNKEFSINKVSYENKEYFIFDKKKRILIFNKTRIKEDKMNPIFYIGNKDYSYLLKIPYSLIKRIVILKENSQEKTLWYNEDIYKKEHSTLCGNKFLGEYLVIANPEDLAFGEILEKKCENCFFRPKEKDSKTCNILPGKGNR